MFTRWGDPNLDNEEMPFGIPSAHPPAGRRLVGVNTPLGIGQMRWTSTGKAWIKGDDFELPLTHFDPATLRPVYESADQRQTHPTPAGGGLASGDRSRTTPQSMASRPPPPPIEAPAAAAPTGSTAASASPTIGEIAAAYSNATTPEQRRALEQRFGLSPYTPADAQFRERYRTTRPEDAPIEAIYTQDPESMIQGLISGDIDGEQLNRTAMKDLGSGVKHVLGLKGAKRVVVGSRVDEYGPLAARYGPTSGAPTPDARGYDTRIKPAPVTDLPGTFWDNKIILSTDGQHFDDPEHPERKSRRQSSVEMNYHEPIHGFDGHLGNLHSSPEFVRAYANDFQTFRKGQSTSYYYKSKGDGGTQDPEGALSDAFAESGAMFYHDPTRLQEEAPHLYEYWRNLHDMLERRELPN